MQWLRMVMGNGDSHLLWISVGGKSLDSLAFAFVGFAIFVVQIVRTSLAFGPVRRDAAWKRGSVEAWMRGCVGREDLRSALPAFSRPFFLGVLRVFAREQVLPAAEGRAVCSVVRNRESPHGLQAHPTRTAFPPLPPLCVPASLRETMPLKRTPHGVTTNGPLPFMRAVAMMMPLIQKGCLGSIRFSQSGPGVTG
jgi:hypothetical protein